jgi:hypothetical protein
VCSERGWDVVKHCKINENVDLLISELEAEVIHGKSLCIFDLDYTLVNVNTTYILLENLIKNRNILFVDFYSSKAYYMTNSFGIFINDKKDIKYNIMKELEKYSDYIEVYDSDDIYQGPYKNASNKPEILVIPKDGVAISDSTIKSWEIKKESGAEHHRFGVLVITDSDSELPPFTKNSIVASHIMCEMGLPLSTEADYLNYYINHCKNNVKTYNYIGKWRIIKKMKFISGKIREVSS